MNSNNKNYLIGLLILGLIISSIYTIKNYSSLLGSIKIDPEKEKELKNLYNEIQIEENTTMSPETDSLPNLIISNIAIDKTKNELYIYLENASNFAVPENQRNGTTAVYIDNMNDPKYTYNWTEMENTNFLSSMGYTNIHINEEITDEHKIKVCVDNTDIVMENYENNCMTVNFMN